MYLDTNILNMDALGNRIQTILSTLLLCVAFSCCSNDDDDLKSYPIVGEWFGTYSDHNQIVMTTIEFSNNGLYNEWVAYVAKENSFNHTREGSYLNSEKIDIIYSTKYNPTQYHKVWRVIEADKYKLHVYDETENSEQTYQRIVDTYDMNVGESRIFSINDANFIATAYRSCDESVATIDDNGEIHAVKRGSTFIQIASPIGHIAIRIKVEDANNIIDDYSSYLNGPISKVIADYGQIYREYNLENGRKLLSYNVIDNVVKAISFHYILEDRIYLIQGEFQAETNIDTIIESFDKKYIKAETKNNLIHNYYFIRNDYYIFEQHIDISIDKQRRTITYHYQPNAYEEFDGMIQLNIDDLLAWYQFDLSIKEIPGVYSASISNPLFDNVIISYDEPTRTVTGIYLTCATNEYIENWYFSHYMPFSIPEIGKVYAKSANFMMSDYYIQIYYNEELDRNVVSYISHKTTSI